MIHKRGRSGGPVFFLAKNPGLWHNGQERKVQPVTSLTKRAIRASFLKLLNERPLNKITVKDIVEDCGINRNSFYYHYTDIPALAEEIVKDEAARIVQEYPTVDSLEQCLEIAVEFALQNRTAVLHLYNSASHEAYEHSLMDICRSVVGSYFDTAFAGKALPEADREVLVRFYQCECYGQIVLWMSQGMQADIVEQFRLLCHLRQGMMEEMVARCCEKSSNYLGTTGKAGGPHFYKYSPHRKCRRPGGRRQWVYFASLSVMDRNRENSLAASARVALPCGRNVPSS